MNNLSYLNQLISVTQMTQTGPGQGGVLDDDNAATASPPDDRGYPQNPFDVPVQNGHQFNQLEGALGDGIEALLPNPVTRHKLAYLRHAAYVNQLSAVQRLTRQWPIPHTLRDKLNAKHQQANNRLTKLEEQLNADAQHQFGWLWHLANQNKKMLSPLSDKFIATDVLWQLADTPTEKAGLYACIMRLKV